MGSTNSVITKTRIVVPMIMGKTPVVAGSKKSFFGIVLTKCHVRLGQPLTMMLPRMTARIARMSNVASPVSPLKKNETKSNFRVRK